MIWVYYGEQIGMTIKLVRYYEDYEVGEEFTTPGRTITESHLVAHAGNAGDIHELQMNVEYAKGTIFGQRAVHTPLVYSIMEGLITSHPELRSSETNICYYGVDKIRVPRPVFVGDTIRVRRTTLEKRPKSDIGGIVKFRDDVYNQRNEMVMTVETLEYVRKKAYRK